MASISIKADVVSKKDGDSLYLTNHGSGLVIGYIPERLRKDIEKGRRQLFTYYLKDKETIQHLRDSLDMSLEKMAEK